MQGCEPKKETSKVSVFVCVFSLVFCIHAISKTYTNAAGGAEPAAPRLIAHAGGEIHGMRLTNSMEALDNSYGKGFRFFEVDVDWTADGIPVLTHDWGNVNWLRGIRYSAKPQSYREFKDGKAIFGLRFMDLGMLEEWLAKHGDAYVITDVKKDNLDLLHIIKNGYPVISSRIIPQIYAFDEYGAAEELGFRHIILTLYRLKEPQEEILEFCRKNTLFGITMYRETAAPETIRTFAGLGVPIYVHPVNDYNEYVKLRDNGAYGIYTDYLQPSEWMENAHFVIQ